ncbi:MAG TPA: hypothetical protein VLB75_02905, partial [Steroidobacteraceae bacterium]|nr:hypothetical protein [Steroidobacteraceae bacterium]
MKHQLSSMWPITATILLCISLAVTAWAHWRIPRLAFINSADVLASYDPARRARGELQQQREAWQQQVTTLERELVAAVNAKTEGTELIAREIELARFRTAVARKSEELETTKMAPVLT